MIFVLGWCRVFLKERRKEMKMEDGEVRVYMGMLKKIEDNVKKGGEGLSELMIKDGMIGLIKFISEVYYINEVEVYIIERIWLEWVNNIGGGRSIERVKEMIKNL